MDNQLKRGLLDICVLAAIKPEPSYGYKIIKDVKPYITISESTLYPILRRLEDSGSLNVNSVEHNGRLRKYYEITDSGHKKLVDFTEEWREIMAIYEFVTKEVETTVTVTTEPETAEAETLETNTTEGESNE
ncbi:MAG: PadR family transcriptional regulator [Lachnospiraceae bacterium]|nr:PadR family transcriptional regulator [Lachnospiraceae bacterium]